MTAISDAAVKELASGFSGDDDPVFASLTGRPLSHRNVQSRGFDRVIDLLNRRVH